MKQNDKDILLYDLAKLHGINKQFIGGYYIPRKRPEKKEKFLTVAVRSVRDFFTLKPFGWRHD